MFRRMKVFLCGFLLLAGFAQAETILIWGDENERPRIYTENGKPHGILVDILRFVEKRSGLVFDIRLAPWARAYAMAEQGSGGIVGLSRTPAREPIFDFSEPVYHEDLLVVSRQSEPIDFVSVSDLSGRRIGVVRGGVYGEAFEAARAAGAFTVVEDNDATQRLRLLLNKRTDVVIVGSGLPGLESAIARSQELIDSRNALFVAQKPLLSDPNFLGFTKGQGRLKVLEQINQVIREGNASGELPAWLAEQARQR